ncbi:hypothetical protein B0H10DRAFT_2434641 [Mycena sp. CBHHK59/15]|nr:hypothetical protein B0H10DRAFT_2434641 [Mycena sp. CBHHK59/15]
MSSYSQTRTPPSPTSSSSSSSSFPPRTPTSPSFQHSNSPPFLVIPSLPEYSISSDAYMQRPKEQHNTAERRASHNAVERARREVLNARFIDLAGLLPNLKHLRRPSKSAIVNSSIAHVRAARRYRLLASQQLRALNAECDMIRHEVNQWRARAGVRPAEGPPRSDGFMLVLGGEEPAFDPVDLEGDDEDDSECGGRCMVPARRAPNRASLDASSEAPLLLSHPYNKHQNGPRPSSAPHATSPVAASFETPNPFDGFLMQQQQLQQADPWSFAQQEIPSW